MTFDPKMIAIAGVLFISNIDGSICEAGWYRNARIEEARWLVQHWRERHPVDAVIVKQRLWDLRDPLRQRAYQEYVRRALMFPELNVRKTWAMAWHNARAVLKTYPDHYE